MASSNLVIRKSSHILHGYRDPLTEEAPHHKLHIPEASKTQEFHLIQIWLRSASQGGVWFKVITFTPLKKLKVPNQ